jgi:hypothetical protein
MNNVENNAVYITFNGLCVLAALFLLSLSVWLAPVDLSTKGYWGMGVIFLAGSLVNLVKYRMDDRINRETISRLEQAKNEKLLKEYVGGAA